MKKKKVKRTKWTPKRFVLLFACLFGSVVSLMFLPWGLIAIFWLIGMWVQAWRDESYGYTKEGKFHWRDTNVVEFGGLFAMTAVWAVIVYVLYKKGYIE